MVHVSRRRPYCLVSCQFVCQILAYFLVSELSHVTRRWPVWAVENKPFPHYGTKLMALVILAQITETASKKYSLRSKSLIISF
jgi:hypothetical protein